MKITFLLGLFLSVTALSYGQESKVKKEQHVKVMVNQNGKTINIDTTFNLPDEKLIQFKVDSIIKKYGKGGMAAGEGNVIILRYGKHMSMSQGGKNSSGEEQMIVFYSTNDS